MRLNLLIAIGFAVAAGFAIGFFVSNKTESQKANFTTDCPEKYKYINDLLDCEVKQAIKKTEYAQLTYELEEYIAKEKSANRLSHVSVYFRDLVGGPTFGIDSEENFVPASLLKVPMMITYFSQAEKDPELLMKETFYVKVNNEVIQSISSDDVIKIETPYTVNELIRRMIVNSDNLAYGLLDKYLNRLYPEQNLYLSTLKELGLVNPRNPTESTFTVKSYSSLFRHLYNSSYLSSEMSEKALELLTQTKFDKALAAGVPNGVVVAHKFGDREGLNEKEKQFHDCGIVYYPDNPYLLCVMTRGAEDDNLVNIIKTISQKVYKEVDSRKL